MTQDKNSNQTSRQYILDEFREILNTELKTCEKSGNASRKETLNFFINKDKSRSKVANI